METDRLQSPSSQNIGVQMTAQELLAKSKTNRTMCPVPETFAGDIEQLAARYVLPNLISPAVVANFHARLASYLDSRDPLFLIRALSETTRGHVYRTNRGGRFKATDNAPAWWIHFALFQQIDLCDDNFAEIIETLPTHFFEVAAQVPESINAAGWHVAHIFSVKDGEVNYKNWSTTALVQRCVRNIHPCNYFFIPRTDWQVWGGNERVIAYFAGLYQEFYGSMWADFLSLSRADLSVLQKFSGPVFYRIASKELNTASPRPAQRAGGGTTPANEHGLPVSYKTGRLSFKADVIEPLPPFGRFRVVTPNGTFEMSKAQFYSSFPNVVKSRSYKERRLYHYPSLPNAVLQFRVEGEE